MEDLRHKHFLFCFEGRDLRNKLYFEKHNTRRLKTKTLFLYEDRDLSNKLKTLNIKKLCFGFDTKEKTLFIFLLAGTENNSSIAISKQKKSIWMKMSKN